MTGFPRLEGTMKENIIVDGEVCAIIVRADYDEPGIRFLTPNEYSQQLASMSYSSGKIIPAHTHNSVRREVLYTQEALFVRRGRGSCRLLLDYTKISH